MIKILSLVLVQFILGCSGALWCIPHPVFVSKLNDAHESKRVRHELKTSQAGTSRNAWAANVRSAWYWYCTGWGFEQKVIGLQDLPGSSIPVRPRGAGAACMSLRKSGRLSCRSRTTPLQAKLFVWDRQTKPDAKLYNLTPTLCLDT